MATVKVEQMQDIYTWVILLNNQSEEIDEKQLSVFGSRGGQISSLMHIALLCIQESSWTIVELYKLDQNSYIYHIANRSIVYRIE